MRGRQAQGLGEDFRQMICIEENGLRKQPVNGKEMKHVYSKTRDPAGSN